MKLQKKKILVTGADGFIGSHLTEALVAQGHDVRAFVYYNSFNSWGWTKQMRTSGSRSTFSRATSGIPTACARP
jgi:nucleoside-diphosphate-sugar epimerase